MPGEISDAWVVSNQQVSSLLRLLVTSYIENYRVASLISAAKKVSASLWRDGVGGKPIEVQYDSLIFGQETVFQKRRPGLL